MPAADALAPVTIVSFHILQMGQGAVRNRKILRRVPRLRAFVECLRTSIIARRRRCVKALRTAAFVRGALVRRPDPTKNKTPAPPLFPESGAGRGMYTIVRMNSGRGAVLHAYASAGFHTRPSGSSSLPPSRLMNSVNESATKYTPNSSVVASYSQQSSQNHTPAFSPSHSSTR